MTSLSFRTRTGSSPAGKPKVYFTCHPDDFEEYFDSVCRDIYEHSDCTIFYTDDMADTLSEDTREIELERMNLFVAPVTARLLTDPNRAADIDLVFATEHNIPFLPLLAESGLDELFRLKFGNIQYLNMMRHDDTEIPYEEKLKRFLERVLFDDEMCKRIRSAFDAYIFLSYRKKDRKFANELMKLIHKDPVCRDIAIWYDEYLVPGENFTDAIADAIKKSKIFTLLVTPNLVNEENYVRNVEYPAAVESDMDIIPAVMADTDTEALKQQFPNIPDPVNAHNDDEFHKAFSESVRHIARQKTENSPEHTFLIGLAYLDGVDVENDRQRGIKLITEAAENDLLEAMQKLVDLCKTGRNSERDSKTAIYWGEKIYRTCLSEYGQKDKRTLAAIDDLAESYSLAMGYKRALELSVTAYRIRYDTFGADNPDTIKTLMRIATVMGRLGNRDMEFIINTQLYETSRRIHGDRYVGTIHVLHNLAESYKDAGDIERACRTEMKCYKLYCEVLGEKDFYSFRSLNSLVIDLMETGRHDQALEYAHKSYDLCRSTFGDEYSETLNALNTLAFVYEKTGDLNTCIELYEKCYAIKCRSMEGDPNTLITLSNLAYACSENKQFDKATEYGEKSYELYKKVFGEKHPNTISELLKLALYYKFSGDLTNEYRCLLPVADAYRENGNYKDEVTVRNTILNVAAGIYGVEHIESAKALMYLEDAEKRAGIIR